MFLKFKLKTRRLRQSKVDSRKYKKGRTLTFCHGDFFLGEVKFS